jgi:outer membrane protein with beta-barrel domain
VGLVAEVKRELNQLKKTAVSYPLITALEKKSNTFAGAKFMRKMFFFVLAAVALLFMVSTQNAQAQSRSETPKVEIGAHYTLLRFSDFDTTDSGVGGRLTYNLSENFGIETEFNFFPQERLNFANGTSLDSRRTQGLFGAKYGLRSEKAGVFGKIRPGFIRFGEGSSPIGVSATEFALDIGGVLELYPTRPVALRFDVGNTLIRYGARGFTSNNLQISTGVAYRF